MDVTSIITNWLDGTNSNYGFLVKFSGSQETDSEIFGQLKFFSSNTNTIYSPKLEVRWDDHSPITGSVTGSLTALDLSGESKTYRRSWLVRAGNVRSRGGQDSVRFHNFHPM